MVDDKLMLNRHGMVSVCVFVCVCVCVSVCVSLSANSSYVLVWRASPYFLPMTACGQGRSFLAHVQSLVGSRG